MPVHLRLNDKDSSRNPYINFVTALPGPRHDEALRRLQQLAAMVKPLMKDQGFHINSLEQYEHNNEFAGRCWNNGEVVELVLTSSNGGWIPLQYVLYVFCHELAHIKHMNHIPHLHGALTRHLKQLALAKQSEGYFGDGLWSAGRQLQGGDSVSGLGMDQATQALPEHVCGGAFRRPRAQRRRSTTRGKGRRGSKFTGASLHSGPQTASNTRGGNRRVKLAVEESSSGSRLDGRDWVPAATAKSKDYKLDDNSTFRKRTQSREAREKRASAALARFSALQQPDSKASVKGESGEDGVKRERREDGVKRESDEESVTDDDDDDDDDKWLVGNDLGEGAVEQHDDDGQFTQADEHETAEQRRRRMERFEHRHGGSDHNRWPSLLGHEGARLGKRKADVECESDDDVVLVEHTRKPKCAVEPVQWSEYATHCLLLRRNGTEPGLDAIACLLCTLENAESALRCAACDTSRGKTTLGS